MELRHLRYFRRVAEQGSFSKAAASLRMTQPSLSRQIQELEVELGHELFERTPKGASVTSAGAGLLRHLELVFAQVDRIPEVTATASRGEQLVRIGVPQGLPHDWFLHLLAAAKREQRGIAISLHEARTYEQQQLIHNGALELAILHMVPPSLESGTVLSQRIGLALVIDSPLAGRKELSFVDLDGMRIMAHASGAISVEESRLRAETAKAGVDIDWVFRQFSEHSSLIASSSEVDAILVTQATAGRHLANREWIPVRADEGSDPMVVVTTLAWRESAPPHITRLVATMRAAALDYQSSTVDHH